MNSKDVISEFYTKALSVNSETRPTAVLTAILSDGYESVGSVESKNTEQLSAQLEFFWKDFMGMPTDGTKSFKIMTIDVHTVQEGKIIKTNHVEDWATALKQLK